MFFGKTLRETNQTDTQNYIKPNISDTITFYFSKTSFYIEFSICIITKLIIVHQKNSILFTDKLAKIKKWIENFVASWLGVIAIQNFLTKITEFFSLNDILLIYHPKYPLALTFNDFSNLFWFKIHLNLIVKRKFIF